MIGAIVRQEDDDGEPVPSGTYVSRTSRDHERVNSARLFVIGVVGTAVSLYMRAAHEQLRGWKRAGDRRAGRWEDTGELGAWKITLPACALLAMAGGVVWLVQRL